MLYLLNTWNSIKLCVIVFFFGFSSNLDLPPRYIPVQISLQIIDNATGYKNSQEQKRELRLQLTSLMGHKKIRGKYFTFSLKSRTPSAQTSF